MQVCIRAHDLGVKGMEAVAAELKRQDLDGVQLVAYKVCPDLSYTPGAITAEQAAAIGGALKGFTVPLIGAYFNPVHSLASKRENGEAIFGDYLRQAALLGSSVVASETGSFNDDKWTYHPRNRTEEALQTVIATFSRLCDVGADCGATVAMEGAAGHVCWSPEVLDRAQKAMKRTNLKVIFDLYNYMDAENQGEYLNILDRGLDLFAGRIHAFHMKDCILKNGERPAQVPFGTGDLDLQQIVGKIKAYDPNATLVLEGTTGEHITGAVSVLRQLWERV